MNIEKQIELEKLKLSMLKRSYDSLPDPKPREKISNFQLWSMPKDKKQKIKEAIRIEQENKRLKAMLDDQKALVDKLEYKKSRYDIVFDKKPVEKKEIVKQEPIFHYDQTAGYSWFFHPIKSLKKWKWRHFNKEETLLINMELDNGKHISFIRSIEDTRFMLFDRTYIIDLKLVYPSLSAGMGCLDYHQSYSLPIRRKWDIDGIKTAIESSGIIDCPSATNPSNITRFLNSNIIEQIFQGAALGNMLMILLILGIVTLLGVIVGIVTLFIKFGGLEKLIGAK